MFKNVVMIGPDPDYSGGIETVIRNFTSMDSDKLKISNIPTWKPHSYFGISFLFTALLKLIRLLKYRNETLLHIHYGHGGSFIRESVYAWVGLILGFKCVGTMHGNNFSTLTSLKWSLLLKTLVFPPLKQIFVLSPSAQLVVQYNNRNALLRPNPLNSQQKWVNLPNRQPYVFFAGRIELRKGIDLLLEAWPRISSKYPELSLKFAGPQGDFPISKLIGLPNSEYLGILRPENIAKHSSSCLALILPSRNEQSPLVIWEAMSSGTLVVSTNVGGIEWILGSEYPFLMTEINSLSLIQAISDLMDNLSNYDYISKQLYERSKISSPVGFLKQYMEDIQSILIHEDSKK